MKKIVSLGMLLTIACSTAWAQYTLDSTRRMSPGVVYKHYKTTSPAQKLYVMEIDLDEPTVRLQAVKANDTINGDPQTVPAMYADHESIRYHEVTAGINSDFFTSGGPKYNPRHMMIGDGEILWDTMLNRTVFGITEANVPFLAKLNESYTLTAGGSSITINSINRPATGDQLVLYNRFKGPSTKTTATGRTEIRIVPVGGINAWKANATVPCTVLAKSSAGNMTYTVGQAVLSGTGAAKTFLDNISVGQTVDLNLQVLTAPSGITNIKQLTGGWTRLVLDGANSVTTSVADEGGPVPTDLAPRTAIGYNQAKDKIYLVVNDGRNAGVSEGMTLTQFADFMLYIGCYQALNLDGGGSSIIMGNDIVRNDPSDAAGPRAVGSALLAYLTTLTLDMFENTLGHFNREPTYSPTTVGVATTSVVTNALTAHSGTHSLIVKLYDNTASSAAWKVRLLSGTGSPSNNRSFLNTGTISFYLKTNTANTNAKVRLWIDDNDGTELSPTLDIINDNQWHKYVWSLGSYAGTSTDGGNGVINSTTATLDAIEFSQPNTSTTWFIFVDDLMMDPLSTEGTQVNGIVKPVEPLVTLTTQLNEEKKEKTGLSVFPNPAKGQFEIRFKKNEVQNFELLVVDNAGRTVHKKTYTGGSQSINLSSLSPGIYYCYVTSGPIAETFKILIN